jgi:DNA-binding Lrp family transcriptional regulator
MDPLDLAIYRFMSPDGEARFWAGRRSIDPTIPVREIAAKSGVSESGVRARLRVLREKGFLRGTTVVPNPSLFGVQLSTVELTIASAGDAPRLFRDLELVDGVLFARDTMEEGSRSLQVHYVSDAGPGTARRLALIRRLSPSPALPLPRPYWIPACERELSALDWRLLRARFQAPDATVAELAEEVGISLKTTARRLGEMLDAKAFWWTHGPTSEELPLALVRVEVQTPRHRGPLADWILREAVDWIPVAADGMGLPPEATATMVAGLVPADAPVVLERLVQRIADRPEVAKVRRTFGLGSASYPAWFAERIAERVPGRS